MKVGFVQFKPIFGEKEKNIQRAIELIGKKKADLFVLPEIFNTGYLFQSKEEVENFAEEIPQGHTFSLMQKISQRRKMNLVFGMAEKCQNKFYNSAVLIQPNGKFLLYRKLHLFFEEKLFFSPGNLNLEVINIGKAKIGIMVCFDWIFPEVARTLALRGAEIICHPSNLILPHCQNALVTRALENRVFFILANRIGTEKRGKRELKFTGKSEIVSPQGKILALASSHKEEVQIIEINPELAQDKNVTKLNNVFEDRRTKFYKIK
jgi:predicted amidohydrolase